MEQKNHNPRLISEELVNTLIKKRDRELHKGDCGKTLVIAGSRGMAGAAVLSVRGALRAGAGLVRISAPEDMWEILQISVPEATCIPRQLTGPILNEHQAVVLGPGLGDDEENVRLIEEVLLLYEGPLLIDADGLNTVARDKKLLQLCRDFSSKGGSGKGSRRTSLILTPHPGEAGRLLKCTREQINADRVGAAEKLSQDLKAIAVLKGSGTLVAIDGGPTYINTTGNPGMATGGSGDVLSGIIGALTGQGLSCEQAAVCGVYLHGKAGDLAAEALGEYGMISSDIAAMTALAFKKVMTTVASDSF
ncbi:MAG: NAD(P)H-hydrate dehydratase [Anaerovoracaceae bacterium]|jgi:hydroxyethylthiazole kinase-like uncharacterized protein yjeF